MGKNRELNEFERGRLRIAGRTHEAIARILKIPKITVTDTIVRHFNSNLNERSVHPKIFCKYYKKNGEKFRLKLLLNL